MGKVSETLTMAITLKATADQAMNLYARSRESLSTSNLGGASDDLSSII
jgi:hypothetical protein